MTWVIVLKVIFESRRRKRSDFQELYIKFQFQFV